MSVQLVPFGTTSKGEEVRKVILENASIRVEVITYGAAVTSIVVPDKNGAPADVVLGYDSIAAYEHNGNYFGALVGRSCNRLAGGRVTLEGVEYPLVTNEKTTQLHGGPEGFSFRVFDVEQTGESAVCFTLVSPDGDQGYPGTLTLRAHYAIGEDASLTMRWVAVTDKTTLCNITNHSYFNLNGHDKAGALAQWLRLEADAYTPADSINIPTGEVKPVAGTPMDFTAGEVIGERILEDYADLLSPKGYDHNFVLRGQGLRRAATLKAPATGIMLELLTDQPGMQLYSGNWITALPGKGGAAYTKYCGIALEPQAFPDAPNHEGFGSTVLAPGQEYDRQVVYRFSVE